MLNKLACCRVSANHRLLSAGRVANDPTTMVCLIEIAAERSGDKTRRRNGCVNLQESQTGFLAVYR